MGKPSKNNFLLIGIGFFILFSFFFILSNSEEPLTIELKKATTPFKSEEKDSVLPTKKNKLSNKTNSSIDTIKFTSGKERVLLIGDSQLEGLRSPVYDYCESNNHELIASALWYGSSTKNWSESDTLSYYIKKYKPTYLFIALGLNELFVNDLDNRSQYIKNIISKVKKLGIRYYWIGPAAWKQDKGICNLLAQLNGSFFYPSQKLKLDRAKDKRHPSRGAARIWFDSVAVQVTKLNNDGLNLSIKKDTIRKIKNSPLLIINQEK
jgi:hypothetical protein